MYQITSKFIETPTRRLLRCSYDFTAEGTPEGGVPNNIFELMAPERDITGAHVRIDLKVWHDEAGKIDKSTLEATIMETAESCDVRIIRIPRENIRAEAVLKAETLRDKILRMAELRGEHIEESVLTKAEALEGTPADELIKRIAG